MPKQFWVIGGEYTDIEFKTVVPGTQKVFGPFAEYDEARQTWRERSLAERALATVRYTIVSNSAAAGAMAA